MLDKLKSSYILERVQEVDPDYLTYEEEMISEEDLEQLSEAFSLKKSCEFKLPNPHNSIMLYLLGITDEFDFDVKRSDMVGGAPPDIDIDFDPLGRPAVIEWAAKEWGRQNVANIITHGTFKPKSLVKSYYRVTEPDDERKRDAHYKDRTVALSKIPKPKFGKEPSFEEVFEANPELMHPRYSGFRKAADKLGGMVSNFGIHAAGVVISDFPVAEQIPTWSNSKAEVITQFDKDEVEELGLIKFDFLNIDTLSIIKETKRLISERTGETFAWDWEYDFPDGDEKAYNLMSLGFLAGIFQMETSGSAKNYIQAIRPESVSEVSDISALNRPGPMTAKLPEKYISIKRSGEHDENLLPMEAEILQETKDTLVYQEQVMRLCSDIAGFTLKEADDIRRAMGKKKKKVLEGYQTQFIDGYVRAGATQTYANKRWNDLIGFADYCLAADTKVLCNLHGKETAIDIAELVELNIAVEVWSVNESGDLYLQEITQWHDQGMKQVFEYELEDGTIIRCTNDHKFLTSEGMVPIEEILEKGLDLLMYEDT